MGPVFGICHAAITDLEHVRIVPVTWSSIGRQSHLQIETNVRHRFPVVADIAGSSPGVATDLFAPFLNVQHAVLTQAE